MAYYIALNMGAVKIYDGRKARADVVIFEHEGTPVLPVFADGVGEDLPQVQAPSGACRLVRGAHVRPASERSRILTRALPSAKRCKVPVSFGRSSSSRSIFQYLR